MRYCGSCISVYRRFVAGIAVVKISNAVLSERRQMTSSRQSPRMSALRVGVLFVPLFDDALGAVCVPLVAGSRS